MSILFKEYDEWLEVKISQNDVSDVMMDEDIHQFGKVLAVLH